MLLLAGCNGSGGGGNNSPPPPVPVTGIYFGTYTINGAASPVNVYGAIDSGGTAYFADQFGTLYVLPTITNTGTAFDGTMTAYAPPRQTFANGQSIATFSVSGNTSSDGVFVGGTFSQPGESGTFQLNYEPLSISRITVSSGSYQGFYWGNGGNTAITITVSPNNTFSGTDGFGCQISGAISYVPGLNLFTVTADSTGQAMCAGKVSGLGFAGTEDLTGQFGGVTGVYFYVGASHANAGFAAEFKSQ